MKVIRILHKTLCRLLYVSKVFFIKSIEYAGNHRSVLVVWVSEFIVSLHLRPLTIAGKD